MFSRILVCLDRTVESELLIPYAEDQARCSGGRIILLNVIDMPAGSVPFLFERGSGERQSLLDMGDGDIHENEVDAMRYLDRHALALREKGVAAEGIIIRGTAGESITAFADENDIDLIIISNRRRTGIGRTVFGSVTDYVLHHAGTSVLAVRTEEESR